MNRFEAFIHYFSKAYHCGKLEYFGKWVGARYPLKVNWSNTCLASSPAEFWSIQKWLGKDLLGDLGGEDSSIEHLDTKDYKAFDDL